MILLTLELTGPTEESIRPLQDALDQLLLRLLPDSGVTGWLTIKDSERPDA